jgi:hypothetical protein
MTVSAICPGTGMMAGVESSSCSCSKSLSRRVWGVYLEPFSYESLMLGKVKLGAFVERVGCGWPWLRNLSSWINRTSRKRSASCQNVFS